MIDTKICNWLMDSADAPIRYRVARELLKDEKIVKSIENELFNNPEVIKGLNGLNQDNFDNAVHKCLQLGLHIGIKPLADALESYVNKFKNYKNKPIRSSFFMIVLAGFLGALEIKDEAAVKHMLEILDELHEFTKKGIYDIYVNAEERSKLTGIPTHWKDKKFINPELRNKYGYCFPLIHDIPGLHALYGVHSLETDNKINAVIEYISTDEFHNTIEDGYGILVDGNRKYHSMGWSPKYPGWFEDTDYIENYNQRSNLNSDRETGILFFAQYISKYPPARKTKWFNDLLNYLEKYKTENGTYIFPKELLPEKTGQAVGGHHMSFGENRRNKIWIEIESTFYMQLLQQNV